MTFVIPNALEVEILTNLVNTALTLRLYGNDITPTSAHTTATFTEIAGGGYAAKALTFINWIITSGNPSVALYNAQQIFTFTGAINAPGNIYGYYITRNSDGKLMGAERFPAATVPFIPVNGSLVKVTPRLSAESA